MLLPYYYGVLIDKSHFLFYYGFLLQKKAAHESEIRFDPSIPDLVDLAISHANVSVNKIFKLFYTMDILLHILWYIQYP
jgi:hypothetical protein